MSALLTELARIVGDEHLLTDDDDRRHYGQDRSQGGWPVDAAVIVRPGTVEEVQQIVRTCAAHRAAIVPSGGRTGLCGAATAIAHEVVVSLSRMHRVLELDATARLLRCEAGVTVEAVQQAAAAQGLLYPVDFAAKGSAQIGGSISTNAGGVKVLRYGSTRSWVQGLRVVVASGECLDLGGSLYKDNTGYDLRQLFIGAEGTLGIVVEATLRLCAPPFDRVVALAAVPDEPRVLGLLAHVQQRGMLLQAFECFDAGCLRRVLRQRGEAGPGPFDPPSPQHALIEIEVAAPGEAARRAAVDELTACLGEAQQAGLLVDAVVAASEAQAKQLWSLREQTSESLHREHPHKSDIAVPVAAMARFLEAWHALVAEQLPGAEPVVFGHIGDGNLHLNLLCPPDEDPSAFQARAAAFDEHAYALVERFDGSVSAEHGIGLLKRDHLHHSRSPGELAMMRAIKQAIDPQGLFNPGKIFAPLVD